MGGTGSYCCFAQLNIVVVWRALGLGAKISRRTGECGATRKVLEKSGSLGEQRPRERLLEVSKVEKGGAGQSRAMRKFAGSCEFLGSFFSPCRF